MPNTQNEAEETRHSFGALNQRVISLEDGSRAVQSQLSNLANRVETLFTGLNTKIEEGRRPQYALLISLGVFALALISAVGFLAYDPIKGNITRLETAMERLATSQTLFNQRYYDTMLKADEKFMTNKEFEGRWLSAGQRRDDIQSLNVNRMGRIEADISAIEKLIVPRGEHEEKWRGADQRFVDIQRQVDAIRNDFTGLYSPRDALTSMQRRLEDLERRLIQSRTGSRSAHARAVI